MTRAGAGFQNWQELRDHLIDAYAESPNPLTEQTIIDAYAVHPAAIEQAALSLIGAADIRSKWAVLAKRARDITTAPSNPSRPTSVELEKRIRRAEQRILILGPHFERVDEITDELFGDQGILKDYKTDPVLVQRMLTLWQTMEAPPEWKPTLPSTSPPSAKPRTSAAANSSTSTQKPPTPSSTQSKPPPHSNRTTQAETATDSVQPSPASPPDLPL